MCRRPCQAALFVGFFVNEALNHVLKTIIQQPRPGTCARLGHGVCDSYGYPSSHSQCIWYIIAAGFLVRLAPRSAACKT